MGTIFGGMIAASGGWIAERNGLQFTKQMVPFGRMHTELVYVPVACGAEFYCCRHWMFWCSTSK